MIVLFFVLINVVLGSGLYRNHWSLADEKNAVHIDKNLFQYYEDGGGYWAYPTYKVPVKSAWQGVKLHLTWPDELKELKQLLRDHKKAILNHNELIDKEMKRPDKKSKYMYWYGQMHGSDQPENLEFWHEQRNVEKREQLDAVKRSFEDNSNWAMVKAYKKILKDPGKSAHIKKYMNKMLPFLLNNRINHKIWWNFDEFKVSKSLNKLITVYTWDVEDAKRVIVLLRDFMNQNFKMSTFDKITTEGQLLSGLYIRYGLMFVKKRSRVNVGIFGRFDIRVDEETAVDYSINLSAINGREAPYAIKGSTVLSRSNFLFHLWVTNQKGKNKFWDDDDWARRHPQPWEKKMLEELVGEIGMTIKWPTDEELKE